MTSHKKNAQIEMESHIPEIIYIGVGVAQWAQNVCAHLMPCAPNLLTAFQVAV